MVRNNTRPPTPAGFAFSHTTTTMSAPSKLFNLTIDFEGRWTIPISVRSVDSGHEVNARVFLDLSDNSDFLYLPLISGLHTADGLMIDGNTPARIIIQTGNFPIPHEAGAEILDGAMGVGFRSAFTQHFDRFIITPSGDGGSGLLVLNPVTPEQYAYGGQWFHVNSLHDQIPFIEASVVIGDYPASSPARFSLSSNGDCTFIPAEAFQTLVRHLERAGFNIFSRIRDVPTGGALTAVRETSGGLTMLYIPRRTAAEIAQVLPPIYFEMVAGTERFRVTIFPEDYIQPLGNGRHVLSIATDNGERLNIIGTNVLRHLALYIDTENRRMGFAEPVDGV